MGLSEPLRGFGPALLSREGEAEPGQDPGTLGRRQSQPNGPLEALAGPGELPWMRKTEDGAPGEGLGPPPWPRVEGANSLQRVGRPPIGAEHQRSRPIGSTEPEAQRERCEQERTEEDRSPRGIPEPREALDHSSSTIAASSATGMSARSTMFSSRSRRISRTPLELRLFTSRTSSARMRITRPESVTNITWSVVDT